MHIKRQFCIASSAYAEDKYVSSVTLENFKDRSVIIFKVFLRVGANYYIELDDFEHEPKILKPYESYTNHYGPVDFYCLNMNRIKLNHLLGSKGVKKSLVLSTSHGKYVVKDRKSTRLNSSHVRISYAVFCLKKKKKKNKYKTHLKKL